VPKYVGKTCLNQKLRIKVYNEISNKNGVGIENFAKSKIVTVNTFINLLG
jgi:hypothetical protein